MLEARNAYGYYGHGSVTGEELPKEENVTRMKYREYKMNFPDHKTISGSYDKEDKTIEVIFSDEEMKKKTNLGNRYTMTDFYFFVKYKSSRSGFSPVVEVKAKSKENAWKNVKNWARKDGFEVVRESNFSEYLQYE